MRRVFMSLVAFVLAGCLVGCSASSYSKNMRAASAQATATVSVKILLDEVKAENYQPTKESVVTVCTEVEKFLDTGKIGDLPVQKAQEAVIQFMIEKGWGQYVPMVAAIFAIVDEQTVPIEKLGADSIQIIKYGLEAAITSANTSKFEWRRQEAKAAKALLRRDGVTVAKPMRVQYVRAR